MIPQRILSFMPSLDDSARKAMEPKRVNFKRCSLVAAILCLSPILVQAQGAPAVPAASKSALDPLNELVDRAITTTSNRFLDAQVHTPWQIIHGLLALRQDYIIKDNGVPVNAVEWISNGATFRGAPWFEVTRHGGRAHPYNGTPYEFEGHVNQFLAVLSMCQLPLDHEFQAAGGQKITMQQMVDHAKMAVSSHVEITWTLWFLTQYLDQDEEWFNEANEPWSMERLVRMQLDDSPYDSPCGGTHGMFALAYARNSYLKKHGELRGVWLEADQKLQRYLYASQRMQNRDGSFATNWFKSTGYSAEFNERVKYSGHMLEWIVVALPKSRLSEQWVRTGVQTLCYDMIRNSHAPAECGPLYHALHALVLYREQVNPRTTPVQQPSLARRDTNAEANVAGPVTNSEEPSDEATPDPVPVKEPVRMATQPEELKVEPKQQSADRKTSSVEKSEPVVTPQPIEETVVNPTPIDDESEAIPVLMPIRKVAKKDEVATTVPESVGEEPRKKDEELELPPVDEAP